MRKWTAIIRYLGFTVAGISIGICLTLFLINGASKRLLTNALMIISAVGLLAVILHVFLNTIQRRFISDWDSTSLEGVSNALFRLFRNDKTQQDADSETLSNVVVFLFSLFSAAKTITLLIFLSGSVLALAQVLLGYMQVERLDKQNSIMDIQETVQREALKHSQISHATDLYLSQAIPLYAEMNKPEFEWIDSKNKPRWSNLVLARIGDVTRSLPRKEIPVFNEEFSIEASDEVGRFFQTLLSFDIPFVPWSMENSLNFSGSNLGGANFEHKLLSNINLNNSNLENVSLRGGNLVNVSLRNSILPTSEFMLGANLVGVDLNNAIVSSATWLQDILWWPLITYDYGNPNAPVTQYAKLDEGVWEIIPLPASNIFQVKPSISHRNALNLLSDLEDKLLNYGQDDEDVEYYSKAINEMPRYPIGEINDYLLSREVSAFLSIWQSYNLKVSTLVIGGAKLNGSYFPDEFGFSEDLTGSDWSNSHLEKVSFKNSNLENVNFENCILPSAEGFEGSNLKNVNLDKATVPYKNWIEDLLTLTNAVKNFDADKWDQVVKDSAPIRREEDGAIVDVLYTYMIVRSSEKSH